MNAPQGLLLEITRPAGAEITAAGEVIRARQGATAADAFAKRIASEFHQETVRLAEMIKTKKTGRLFAQPDGPASVRWSQPIYKLRIETAQKRRRNSSTGLYYAYYALFDSPGNGQPDTLRILAFRHSAAQPISEDGEG